MSKNANILLVSNQKESIHHLANILMEMNYSLQFATDSGQVEQAMKRGNSKLVIIDEKISLKIIKYVIETLKKDPKSDIPVLIALHTITDAKIATVYKLGAIDYLSASFNPKELLTRISMYMSDNTDEYISPCIDENVFLENEEMIFYLLEMVDLAVKSEESHIRNVSEYAYLLATLQGLDATVARYVRLAAALHDIGQFILDNQILINSDTLKRVGDKDNEQREEHTILGYKALVGSKNPILHLAAIIAHEHHEKFNGSGFPQGLKANEIHPFAQLVAVADTFDRLSSTQANQSWNNDILEDREIVHFFELEKGHAFNPEIVDTLLKNTDKFFKLRTELANKRFTSF